MRPVAGVRIGWALVRTWCAQVGFTDRPTGDDTAEKAALRTFKLDLHIHTVLSPCTEIADMTPRRIARTASERGLDMIAVCDHNSARNVGAVIRAACGTPLAVMPGLEVATLEEIHIVTLFPTMEGADRMQDEVYSRLPGRNDEDVFGCQVVADEFDQVEDLDERLLIGASTIPVERLVQLTHELGGLAIASHVDRSGFGIFGQLGFIPDDLELDALEVSYRSDYGRILAEHKEASRYPLITSSDAHYPEDIGRAYTTVLMASATFEELRMALGGREGRGLVGRSVRTTS